MKDINYLATYTDNNQMLKQWSTNTWLNKSISQTNHDLILQTEARCYNALFISKYEFIDCRHLGDKAEPTFHRSSLLYLHRNIQSLFEWKEMFHIVVLLLSTSFIRFLMY